MKRTATAAALLLTLLTPALSVMAETRVTQLLTLQAQLTGSDADQLIWKLNRGTTHQIIDRGYFASDDQRLIMNCQHFLVGGTTCVVEMRFETEVDTSAGRTVTIHPAPRESRRLEGLFGSTPFSSEDGSLVIDCSRSTERKARCSVSVRLAPRAD